MTEIANKYRKIEGCDDGHIRILDEQFKGVAVSLGRISIDDSGKEETATLKYDYDVLELPDGIELDEQFDNLLGDIIVDIIETKLNYEPDSLRFTSNEDWKSNIKFYIMQWGCF